MQSENNNQKQNGVPLSDDETRIPADSSVGIDGNSTASDEDASNLESDSATSDTENGQPPSTTPKTSKKKTAIIASAIVAVIIVVVAFLALNPWIYCQHPAVSHATCTKPGVCLNCDTELESPLGHDWQNATCTEPKTCSRCGATEGEPLGHAPGEWKDEGIDYVSATHSRTLKCTVCGATVDTDEQKIDSFIDNGEFAFTPAQFRDRFDDNLSSITGLSSDLSTIKMGDSGLLSYALIGNGSVGMLSFSTADGQSNTQVAQENERCNPSPVVLVDMSDPDAETYVAALSIILVETCDPSLSFGEAKLVAMDMIGSGTSKNGIDYLFTSEGDFVFMRAVVS